MYGFPPDLDLSGILGCDLNQICLGRYDLQFVFGVTRIAVQSRATIFEGEEVISDWTEQGSWTSLAYQRLLMNTVQGFQVLDKATLEIRFVDGLSLHLHDDSEQYECIQIYHKGDYHGPMDII